MYIRSLARKQTFLAYQNFIAHLIALSLLLEMVIPPI